jgi:ABC-type amino acid transport system permease subunit
MGFFEFAASILPRLLAATTTTLKLTAGSIALGLAAGILLALGRVYGVRPVRWLTNRCSSSS